MYRALTVLILILYLNSSPKDFLSFLSAFPQLEKLVFEITIKCNEINLTESKFKKRWNLLFKIENEAVLIKYLSTVPTLNWVEIKINNRSSISWRKDNGQIYYELKLN